jgi:hypothetical protein
VWFPNVISFALQRVGLRQIRQTIEDSAQNVETLQQANTDIRQLALQHAGPRHWRRATDPVHLSA